MQLNRIGLFFALILTILLTACGGGSGSSENSSSQKSSSDQPVVNKVTGYVVLGPIAGAKVSLYAVSIDGGKQLLATTSSDSKGFFGFPVAPPENAVVLIEATGGSYLDEATQKLTQLDETVRAMDKWTTRTSPLSVTAHSEIAVRRLITTDPNNWSAEKVDLHNKEVADALGTNNLLDYVPVNLAINQDWANLRDQDVLMSIWAGTFSGLMHELPQPTAGTALNNAIEKMSQVLFDNEYDDISGPAFIKGMALFVKSTQLPTSTKTTLLNGALFGTSSPPVPNSDAAIPTGKASGSATKAMLNDAFELLPEPSMSWISPVGTVFNKRGALIAYQSANFAPNVYREIYSASVGEMFGDGEIGIGRWHGGVAVTSNRTATGFDNQKDPEILPADGGRHYGVGTRATQIPSCGLAQLALRGNTKATAQGASNAPQIVGLAPDSKVALQYAGGSTFIGFDLGLQLADNTVVRFQSNGGLTAPWDSGYSIGSNGHLFIPTTYPTTPLAALPDLRLSLTGLHAGMGGRKLVAGLDIYSSVATYRLNAAFGTSGQTDLNGCATDTPSLGTNISPAPANGIYSVFAGFSPYVTSVPSYTIFGTRGELKGAGFDANTIKVSIPASTQTYELNGNQSALIGRTIGPVSVFDYAYNLSMPYAVAQQTSSLPATGSRRYVLIGSTSVVLLAGSGINMADVSYGTVSSATLDVTFGQTSNGTPSPLYGSARVDIRGSVAGTNFTLKNNADSNGNIINADLFANGGGLDFTATLNGAYGTLAGPNGEYAVIRLLSPLGSGFITSALLFKAQ